MFYTPYARQLISHEDALALDVEWALDAERRRLVESRIRQLHKSMMFAANYGISAKQVAKQANIDVSQAEIYMSAFKATFGPKR